MVVKAARAKGVAVRASPSEAAHRSASTSSCSTAITWRLLSPSSAQRPQQHSLHTHPLHQPSPSTLTSYPSPPLRFNDGPRHGQFAVPECSTV